MSYAKPSLQGIMMLILYSSINTSGAAKPFTSRVFPNSAEPEQSYGISQSTATGHLEKSQLVPLAKSGVHLIYREMGVCFKTISIFFVVNLISFFICFFPKCVRFKNIQSDVFHYILKFYS